MHFSVLTHILRMVSDLEVLYEGLLMSSSCFHNDYVHVTFAGSVKLHACLYCAGHKKLLHVHVYIYIYIYIYIYVHMHVWCIKTGKKDQCLCLCLCLIYRCNALKEKGIVHHESCNPGLDNTLHQPMDLKCNTEYLSLVYELQALTISFIADAPRC